MIYVINSFTTEQGDFCGTPKRCVCIQMANVGELVGTAQPRQLLEDLPLTKSSAYLVQSSVSEEIAFTSMFNSSVSLFSYNIQIKKKKGSKFSLHEIYSLIYIVHYWVQYTIVIHSSYQ